MMGVDLARAFDPCLLASDVGIVPDDWQAKLLRERPRRALLCCARQSGKTVVTVLLALWVALYEVPALVLILSPSLRQSGEVFRTLMGFYAKLKGAPELRQESVLRCEFANGSRIGYIFNTYGLDDLTGNPILAAAIQVALWDLSLNNDNPTSFGQDAGGT